MKKLLLTVSCALLLMCGMAVPALAADEDEAQMLQVLAVIGAMTGDENGDLNLTDYVTRAEFTKLAVKTSVYRDAGATGGAISPYPDVTYKHWAAGFVTVARDAGWLSGYLDGTFRPGNQVTLAEAVTEVLRMLGYDDSYFSGAWPSGQMALYKSLGLNEHITAMASSPLTRRQCAWLIYNSLSAATAGGVSYAVSLGYALDASGQPDFLSLVNKNLSGPLIAGKNTWQNSLGFTPRVVYRNDSTVTAAEINAYDVLYYISDIATVWAYSSRQTGRLDAVLPNRAAPASVTVAGMTYTLGTSQARQAVSDLGQFKVGDTVTLLLGRGDAVAGIVSTAEADMTTYGVVRATGKISDTTAEGAINSYDYVDVLTVGGALSRFAVRTTYAAGEPVSVRAGANGSMTVNKLSRNSSIFGKISADGAKLGTEKLAADVEIFDVYKDTGIVLSASRLAGVTLSTADILWCGKNAAGEIDCLLLNDVSGDVHSYGLLTDIQTVSAGSLARVTTYSYTVAGRELSYPCQNTNFSTAVVGPAQFMSSSTAIMNIKGLKQLSLSSVSGGTAYSGQTAYTLSGSVQTYILRGGDYYYTNLTQVTDGSYNLTGWYDKAESNGGRVRVIIATPKPQERE